MFCFDFLLVSRFRVFLVNPRMGFQKIFVPSTIYGSSAYEESQMKDADALKRQQRSELEYDC